MRISTVVFSEVTILEVVCDNTDLEAANRKGASLASHFT